LKKPEPTYSQFVFECINEFAEFIVEDNTLFPVDLETVSAAQTRPAQKLSLLKACLHGPVVAARKLKCFIKSEAYADVKDPRNISQYADEPKLQMGRFAMSMASYLKKFDWYGPGKTPLQIATRVAAICEGAEFVNLSDYHRMDGTITYALRQLDKVVFTKAFKHDLAELNELLRTNAGNIGTLPLGTTFEQGPSHGSGCSATSVSQTLRATFTSYLAYRNMRSGTSARYSARKCFKMLGLHFGDDGIDPGLPTDNHTWAAKKVGLVLEAALVQRGDRGVNFLARYYSPDVWFGSPDSMCDIKRQLGKFHVTVSLPHNVGPEDKLAEKARSYVSTDANTPVIGPFCKRAVSYWDGTDRKLGVGHWWGKFAESEQYPNTNGTGWMDAEFQLMLPGFDVETFDIWLESTTGLTTMLRAPLCHEIDATSARDVAVVVDGVVVPAEMPATALPAKETVPIAKNDEQKPLEKRKRKRNRDNNSHKKITELKPQQGDQKQSDGKPNIIKPPSKAKAMVYKKKEQ
jgi:hypothetical protein